MARDAVAFMELLGFSKVDLLGYSLGAALPSRWRPSTARWSQLILVGTAPQGGEEHLMAVLKSILPHRIAGSAAAAVLHQSAASQAAARRS